MSDKPQKPAEHDPEATVMMTPGALKGPEPHHDPEATVMMTPGALKGPDPAVDADATVMMPAGIGKVPPAEAPRERVPMAAFQRDDDPDATVIGAPPPEPEPEPEPATEVPPSAVAQEPAGVATPVAAAPESSTPVSADTSRMPLIAGGVVVLAVALYFGFGGGKAPAPVAPKPEAAAPAPAAEPAAPAPVSSAAPAAPAEAAKPLAKAGSLKDLLAAETKRGHISVSEEGGATTIALTSTNQFASGGTELEPKLHASIAAVAAALDKVPGAIVVTGHADAKPSTNARFPTNDALSAARGASVAKLLSARLHDPKRVTSAGAGDTQQVAPSDTPENRAKNRRVVIVLRPAP